MSTIRPLALSSMWIQHRFDHLPPFLAAGRTLGFNSFELSHIVTPPMLDGLGDGEGIVSLHYPAPTVPHPATGRAADALLSSPDEEARRWAVARGRMTMDTARAVGARAVVVHLGEVQLDTSQEWALRQRYLAGQAGTLAYERARARVWDERERLKAPYLTAARRSLEELAEYAAQVGLRLGLETRFHAYQIPSLEELIGLLAEFAGETVGYWHDTGHAQALANLGFWPPTAWLEAAGARLIGVHLHDCRGWRDHLIPGLGEVDFAGLARRLSPDTLCVCEFDWYYEEDEIREGVQTLRRMGL